MKNRLNWLEAVLLVAPLVAVAMLWNDLPARVPVHWNPRGEINGWASKPVALLSMPLINIAVIALLHFLPRIDPKLRRSGGTHGRMESVLAIVRLALAAFFAAIFCMQVAATLGHKVAADRIAPTTVLLLLAVIGNYLSNLRPNYFVGIRTPWTLESPATWRATHRLWGLPDVLRRAPIARAAILCQTKHLRHSRSKLGRFAHRLGSVVFLAPFPHSRREIAGDRRQLT